MKKGNIVEFTSASIPKHDSPPQEIRSISDELAIAIQELIDRMRNFGPLTQ